MADKPKQPKMFPDGITAPGDLDFDDATMEELYARHAEIKSFADLEAQRGTPIPTLFNTYYKFIQNPSSISVETFKRMVDTDDTIGSGVDFLTTCLAARLGGYTHPNDEIAEFVTKALDHIDGGFFNAVKELLSASWAGYAVQEKVWENDPDLGFVVKKLASLPPSTILFEVDRTGELTDDGILQYQRNWNPLAMSGGIGFFGGALNGGYGFNGNLARPDMFAKFGDLPFPLRTANSFNYLSIRIPKQKCIHYAFDAQGKFQNPYGRSLLRRAYKYYVMKDAFLQMLATALDRKGTPLTVVYADANATLIDPTKTNVKGQNPKGKYVGISAVQAASDAFKNIHNDTTIILPGKKGTIFDTDFVNQTSNHDSFISAIDLCNKGIMRALLLPSLVFTAGDGSGSYALGQEHAKTFDKILDGMLEGLKGCLLHQLVHDIIAYNFPKEKWEKDGLGKFGKRELGADEIEKEMNAIAKAVEIGAADMNDLEDLNIARAKAGFNIRTEPFASHIDNEALDEDSSNPEANGDGDGEDGSNKNKQNKGDEADEFPKNKK